jgi:hypothetical protein
MMCKSPKKRRTTGWIELVIRQAKKTPLCAGFVFLGDAFSKQQARQLLVSPSGH